MTYDENNNVKTEDIYTIKSGVETSRHKSMYENQYDTKKRLIQVINKHYDEDDGWVIQSKKTLEYKTNSEIEEYYVYNTLTGEYSLSNKSIYTYDNNGCLVNQKDYDIQENDARETVITVDKYGCAVLAELYYLSMDDVRGDKIVDTKTTYLDNLWYRPLKSEQIPVDSSEDKFTSECEYNDKRQIVSEKRFRNEECVYHYTYEY